MKCSPPAMLASALPSRAVALCLFVTWALAPACDAAGTQPCTPPNEPTTLLQADPQFLSAQVSEKFQRNLRQERALQLETSTTFFSQVIHLRGCN